jgi:hypothetical protein
MKVYLENFKGRNYFEGGKMILKWHLKEIGQLELPDSTKDRDG